MQLNKFVLLFFIFLCVNSNSQSLLVYNSCGDYSQNSDFSVISSFSEPITSIGINVENGFLSYNSGFVLLTTKIEEDRFHISPNPADDVIYIDQSIKSELTIYNSLGQVIGNYSLKDGNNIINVESLPSGLYYFTFRDEYSNLITRKIIKS